MIVSDFAIKNRSSVLVLIFIIVVTGLYSYINLPRESSPDVQIPYVFVSTSYRGVSPDDIESSITSKIEDKLKGLKNVKKISSNSSEGLSSIAIEFVTGTKIEDALQWVKDKVDMAKRELPSDLENDPAVFEVNLSELPVMTIALKANMSLRELKLFADKLKDDIEALSGVLGVDIYGGLERQIMIEVDPDKLAVYGIPFDVIYSIINTENQNVSGGSISMDDGRYQIKVPGEINSIKEFQELVVFSNSENTIYLRDVANIIDSTMDEESRSRLNFENSINIDVKKRSGENIIKVIDSVKEMLNSKKDKFPDGLSAKIVKDMSLDIRFMLNDLENNIITGFILVLCVLMFSMGFRNALLASISIPISMLLSFTVLYGLGITLNMITLFSVILASGMLVDNAIVIVENIFRFTSQGVPRLRAARKATSEVAWPVIASTATTVAAFFPMLGWPGIMGDFMKYLPITLIITLCSSLFVAMVINPVLCSIFMNSKISVLNKNTGREEEEHYEKYLGEEEQPVHNESHFMKIYHKFLTVCLNNRMAVIISSFLLLIFMISGWFYRTGIERGVEFFPEIDPPMCFVNIDPPSGMDLENLNEIALEIENRLKDYNNIPEKYRNELGKAPDYTEEQLENFERLRIREGIQDEDIISDIKEIRFIYTNIVSNPSGSSIMSEGNLPNHIGIQFHKFELRNESSKNTLERIRNRLDGIPGANITISKLEEGPPTGAPVNIEISGDNLKILGEIGEKVKSIVEKIPYVTDVESDYSTGSPTLELVVDRKKAALFGVSTALIGSTVKTAINGWNISTYREDNDDYDVYVRVSEDYRKDINILKKLFITSSTGIIPLSDLVKIKYSGGLSSIRRIDHQRVVTVKGDVNAEKMPGAVARMIAAKMLKQIELPAGYNITFTGENDFQGESQKFLTEAFMIALFLVFFVLVLQFNSVMNTFIIMVSVILSLGGIFLGLWVSDIPFGIIMTGIGVISLAGVVVNNAIVLLDYTITLMNRGFELDDAVINGAKTRLRPVILTAITTILGLVPMITGISFDFTRFELSTSSQSSQWWFSMAIAVAFGLAVATILTLVVVPVIFHLITDIKIKLNNFIKKRKETFKEV